MALMQILIFAAIAVFVLIKLYNVLGKDVGAPPGTLNNNQPNLGTPASTPTKAIAATPLRPAFTGPAAAGLEAIHSADSDFEPKRFIEGAKIAYERIVCSFSKGEKKALKSLLQPEVYARYNEAIDAREKSKTIIDTEIIRIKKAEIKEAELEGREARVVVEFSVDISTREAKLDAADDEDARVQQLSTTEEWTFVRDTRARDPNWKLDSVATLA